MVDPAVACIEFPFLLLTFGVLGALAVGLWSLLVVGPVATVIWLVVTRKRRAAIRIRLALLGWPPMILLPDLLVYGDTLWTRLPRYDDMAVIPKFLKRGGTRALLWKTLQTLEDASKDEADGPHVPGKKPIPDRQRLAWDRRG